MSLGPPLSQQSWPPSRVQRTLKAYNIEVITLLGWVKRGGNAGRTTRQFQEWLRVHADKSAHTDPYRVPIDIRMASIWSHVPASVFADVMALLIMAKKVSATDCDNGDRVYRLSPDRSGVVA